jgi:predicted GIY-YIG superfamily endonuclease
MRAFFYVYILVSQANKTIHDTGVTRHLDQHLLEHNRDACPHTCRHRPWRIETAVAFESEGGAGSSHEALNGSADNARFFLARDLQAGREILRNRRVGWVLAYDWDRVAQNSAGLFGESVPDHASGHILDRTPGSAPPYLVLSGQNQAAKLFRFADKL